MKRSLKILTAGAIVFFLLGAPSIRFDALMPAIIDLSSNIKKVALIDRSLKVKNGANIAEGIATGELLGKDSNMSHYTLDGFVSVLNESGIISVFRTEKKFATGSREKEMPKPLSWDEVENLCEEYETDAIVSLEVYDSDFIPGSAEAYVTIGFRIYNPLNRIIEDQFLFNQKAYLGNYGHSIAGAISKLMEKDQAVRDVSFQSGYLYAQRIVPTWFPVERRYYKSPKNDGDLSTGARYMEVNDWDNAIETLEKTMKTAKKRKTLGRSAHNLAVVFEVKGDLEKSIEWAQAAWAKYKNKGSREYLQLLKERQMEIRKLNNQLEE